ncbi:unnamed protein product [Angiostrongylus costaricensis]|uniref:RING-type domain-containing protein n=1 Tax=Angiostrongylus costaricensis TaxID=334426 RepID=A0A158PME1_ANGCS|nr:unnamed protein product [Angiostrongylus costaricensis]
MTSRRKGVYSCVEDDVQYGAPPPRRAKNLTSLRIHAQLMGDGTAESSRSSLSSTKSGIMDCKEVVGVSIEGDAETTSNVCAICLMPGTDPALLNKCSYSCRSTCTSQWLKRAEKCPLCMTPVSSFSHNLDLPPRLLPVVLVADLLAVAEVARLVERGGLCISDRTGVAQALELIILHNLPVLVYVLSMKLACLKCSSEIPQQVLAKTIAQEMTNAVGQMMTKTAVLESLDGPYICISTLCLGLNDIDRGGRPDLHHGVDRWTDIQWTDEWCDNSRVLISL